MAESDGGVLLDVKLNPDEAAKEFDKLSKKATTLEEKLAQQKAELAKSTNQAMLLAEQLDAAKAKQKELTDRSKETTEELKKQNAIVSQKETQVAAADSTAQWLRDVHPEGHPSVTAQEERAYLLGEELVSAVGKQKDLNNESNALTEQLKQQGALVKQLQGEYTTADKSATRMETAISKTNAELTSTKEKAALAAKEMSKGSNALALMGEGSTKVENRLKRLASRVLVFSVFTMALRSLRSWLADVVKTDKDAVAAMAQLKGALLTLVQPLVGVVIPAFTAFVRVVGAAITELAKLVSFIFGTTIDASAAAAANLDKEKKAFDGVGTAAKKAGKSLASFDEINKVGDKNESAGGGGSSSAISPDFSGMMSDEIGALEAEVSGAILALGAILTFTGANIPIGLGLLAVGAMGLGSVIEANADTIIEALQGPIGAVVALLSTALLAVGAVLAFSGTNLFLGIALMEVGAGGLAAAAAANWDVLPELLQGPVGAITALLSIALLAVGAILAFSGVKLGLGIALMAAGAVGLVAVIAANWYNIPEILQGPIGIVTAIVSGALLVLGAILAFSGAHIGLGIALMAAGAIGLETVASVNWETIQNAMRGPVGTITALVGGALLALGAILALSGVNLPLGLALMAAGGVALATAIAPNWDAILDMLKGAWSAIKNWWGESVVPALKKVPDFFKDNVINKLLDFVEGFINFFIRGINGLISKINSVSFDVPDWVPGIGGSTFGFNLPKVSELSLPRLATGAVIPPNREFAAILGDQKRGMNVEAPADLIRQMVIEGIQAAGGGATHDITVILQLDRRELGRTVYTLNNEETQRVGVRLAGVRT